MWPGRWWSPWLHVLICQVRPILAWEGSTEGSGKLGVRAKHKGQAIRRKSPRAQCASSLSSGGVI